MWVCGCVVVIFLVVHENVRKTAEITNTLVLDKIGLGDAC